jgi:hypothetical protein
MEPSPIVRIDAAAAVDLCTGTFLLQNWRFGVDGSWGQLDGDGR